MEATSLLDELKQIKVGFLYDLLVVSENNLMLERSSSIADVHVPPIICVLKIPVLVFSLAKGLEGDVRIRLSHFVFSQDTSLDYSATKFKTL